MSKRINQSLEIVDFPINGGAKYMNLMRSLLLFVTCVYPLSFALANNTDESLIDTISPNAIEIVCGNNYFLDKSNLDLESCIDAAKQYVKKCAATVRPLEPDLAIEGDDLANEEAISSVSILYGICLQWMILMSDAENLSSKEEQ